MNAWLLHVRTAGLVLLVMTAITGLVYPLAITGVAQVLFHEQANGSIVERSDQRVGSSLIGQGFVDQMTGRTLPGYFRGRPSAAGAGYDAASSGGSNLGPTSAVLKERIAADVAIIREENGLGVDVAIPVDLVTASGSGLDPHISRASAEIQVDRVARERGLSEAQVRDLVDAHTQGPLFGLFGEERVNVLELNLALDALAP
jgi:K+-transporting ATPase ATPase C chain